jgi:DNA-binding XRE family transcriptional regulator
MITKSGGADCALVTKGLGASYDSLSETVKSAMLALSVLLERVQSLPKEDRNDLFELVLALRDSTDPSDQQGIRRAMEEILCQAPITFAALPGTEDQPLSQKLKSWSEHVGQKIRQLREGAGLNQAQLAEKAGLTQSHVSRLENAEHSPTHFTLVKIAGALGVPVGQLDPSDE